MNANNDINLTRNNTLLSATKIFGKNLKFYFVLFLFTLSFTNSFGQVGIKYELGFKLMPTAGTKVVTFAILSIDTTDNNKIVKTEFVNEGTFIKYCKGLLWNKANQKKINHFDAYEIDCGIMLDDPMVKNGFITQDTMWDEMAPLCLPFYDIWKLKYGVHPHYSRSSTNIPDEDKGWAKTRYRPGYTQTQKLQEYGVNNVDDYFYGDGMFRLLKDMQDFEWIENYKALGNSD